MIPAAYIRYYCRHWKFILFFILVGMGYLYFLTRNAIIKTFK